ncbi:MAG TPA: S41 family peptidase, partial [Bryobacteraceae bacterium]|nr:S41 family peptidase [Bryobacteraceae bacterium]
MAKPPVILPPAKTAAPVNPDLPPAPAEGMDRLMKQFVDTLALVQGQAAEPASLDKLIYEGAIPSMLRQLDPHTQFFDPAQFQQLKQMEDSEQKGFGSVVSVLPGEVIFLQTLPGTPSNKVGIQPGDELVAINNIAIGRLQPEQIVQLLTEARQQRVTAYIRRQGSPRLLAFVLTPELVDAPSVDRTFLLTPGFGYIRIASWDLQTATQLQVAIEKLGGNSLKGLILDLRNNPGGIVKTALDAAALFLDPGQKILTVKGRIGEGEAAEVPKYARPYKFKMSVIVNAKTASASEILAGALQDHDRATIVGEPSYGKGLVQTVLPLSSGAGLAITTAFYYTPSGRSIQHPLQNSALSDTFQQVSDRDRPRYLTDHGRTVLGGGGIQPDIVVSPFIPNRLEEVIDSSASVTNFATQYLQSHTPLSPHFEVTPEIIDEFQVFLSSRNIQPSLSEWTSERSWITSRL